MEAFNIRVNDEEVFHNISSCSIETVKNDSINKLSVKEFDLIISTEQWKTIMPVRKLYERRYKYVLQSSWTDVITEKMWQQQKLHCTLTFKKHDVHQSSSAKYYIGIHGICKECNAKKGRIIEKPRDNVDIKIHFIISNVQEEKHSYITKRQLRGKRRKIVSATLIERKIDAITFRRQEAKRLKDFGDIEPSIISNAAVLRKAKEQRLLERHRLIRKSHLKFTTKFEVRKTFWRYSQYWLIRLFLYLLES